MIRFYASLDGMHPTARRPTSEMGKFAF